ncbi:MAG: hypothetical protein COA62_11895 [Rhodobiaceae bacterium]|nr:MAG: hypothetical protein COA62_11895 [Rhodobiaceae bacterium]
MNFPEFVEAVQTMRTPDEIVMAWGGYMNENLGPIRATYGYFIKGALPGRDQYFASTFDSSFLDDYAERDRAAEDLAYQFAERGAGPFTWDRLKTQGEWSKNELVLFEDSSDAGMKVGMSSSLFSEPGILACFSAASEQADFDMDRHMAEIYAVTCVMHRAHISLLSEWDERIVPFTKREREVFTLVARGKSSWDIGEILLISEATVKFHIANCFRKLGVNARIPAVLKAVYTKQISLDPSDILVPIRSDSTK